MYIGNTNYVFDISIGVDSFFDVRDQEINFYLLFFL